MTLASKVNWPIKRLGDLAEFRNGLNYNKSSFGEGVKVVGVSDFQDYTKPRYGELAQINPEGIVTERNILRDGDIVFVRSNGNPELVGRSLFIEKPPEEVTHSAFTIRLRFNSREVHPKFYAYCFRTSLIRQGLTASGGGTNISNLNQDILNALEVPLPPLPVQRRIASILSSYDELMENSQRRIHILEAMARALYREWFVHFRFPGHKKLPRVASPLGDIPRGWEVKQVKDVAQVTYGFPFQSKKFNTTGAGTPVIRIRDILEGSIDTFTDEEAEPKYHIKNGDILVGMDGDFHMCIWSSGHAFQNQRIAKFESSGEIGNYHLFLALELPIQTWNRSIVGTTVAHLGDMHIKTIQIAWPPAKLLAKAREVLEPMAEQILALNRQIRNLRRTRDLLLPRLIAGQWDLQSSV